jgi:hypothetical protein
MGMNASAALRPESDVGEIDRSGPERLGDRCTELMDHGHRPSPPQASPLRVAAEAVLRDVDGDIGLDEVEATEYVNALRIVHGDDHEMVAAYDRGRLAESGAVRQARARLKKCPTDRNLVTVEEFASAMDIAVSTVFELLKLGLPSIKSAGLGRRVLRQQAEAWLIAGGASRSRAAKSIAKGRRGKEPTDGR